MYIAILEDEFTLAEEVKNYLEQNGHHAKIFIDGEALLRALTRENFDLFILDWNVPKISGYEVLVRMRKNLGMVEPIVFLTSTDAEDEIVSALSAGADDYCVKPIRLREFSARIQSVQRRSNKQPVSALEATDILGYNFNAVDNVISFNGHKVPLTQKEFNLALFLFSELDRPISRNRILLEVWGTANVELSRTLDVHIAWIRKKLNIGSSGQTLRLTAVYGYGYRLMQTFTED
jgi:DNA-binding response OmpR family regulator